MNLFSIPSIYCYPIFESGVAGFQEPFLRLFMRVIDTDKISPSHPKPLNKGI
jgi:hypothetical protein